MKPHPTASATPPTTDALTLPKSVIGDGLVMYGYPKKITHAAHKGKLAEVEEIQQELGDEQSRH